MTPPTHPLTDAETAQVAHAHQLAQDAHTGQQDKAGQPYFTSHILDVHRRVVAYGGGAIEQIAALLHDVVEDTPMTLAMLQDHGVNADSLRIVELLTKTKGTDLTVYYAAIAAHEPARRVKLYADVASNTDPARVALLTDSERLRFAAKYAKATAALAGPAPS